MTSPKEKLKDKLQMRSEFDEYAKNYQEKIEQSIGLFGQKHDFFVENKIEHLTHAFSQIGALENMKILDVGCGIGLGHHKLSSYFNELHGVDVSSESISFVVLEVSFLCICL